MQTTRIDHEARSVSVRLDAEHTERWHSGEPEGLLYRRLVRKFATDAARGILGENVAIPVTVVSVDGLCLDTWLTTPRGNV